VQISAPAATPPTRGTPAASAQGREAAPSRAADDASSAERPGELSQEQRAQVEKLKARDREVRAHEAAHQAAAGGLARGGASFSYQVGPDHRRYAVGGEVSIDVSAVPDDPRATLRKAETVRAAALAPARPSGQDHAVAARAAQMAVNAQRELLSAERANTSDSDPTTLNADPIADPTASPAARYAAIAGEGETNRQLHTTA